MCRARPRHVCVCVCMMECRSSAVADVEAHAASSRIPCAVCASTSWVLRRRSSRHHFRPASLSKWRRRGRTASQARQDGRGPSLLAADAQRPHPQGRGRSERQRMSHRAVGVPLGVDGHGRHTRHLPPRCSDCGSADGTRGFSRLGTDLGRSRERGEGLLSYSSVSGLPPARWRHCSNSVLRTCPCRFSASCIGVSVHTSPADCESVMWLRGGPLSLRMGSGQAFMYKALWRSHVSGRGGGDGSGCGQALSSNLVQFGP